MALSTAGFRVHDHGGIPGPGYYLERAQIQATLALVEQQRIANLIALRQTFHCADDGVHYTTRTLDADIAASVGVTGT